MCIEIDTFRPEHASRFAELNGLRKFRKLSKPYSDDEPGKLAYALEYEPSAELATTSPHR